MKTKEEIMAKVEACLRRNAVSPEMRNQLLGLFDGIWQNGYAHGHSAGYDRGVQYITDGEMKKLREAHKWTFVLAAKE